MNTVKDRATIRLNPKNETDKKVIEVLNNLPLGETMSSFIKKAILSYSGVANLGFMVEHSVGISKPTESVHNIEQATTTAPETDNTNTVHGVERLNTNDLVVDEEPKAKTLSNDALNAVDIFG